MALSTIEVEHALAELYAVPEIARGSRRVSEVILLGSGYEADAYAFSVQAEDAADREELVLRVYDGAGAAAKAAREFAAMLRLREAGYPVPRVTTLERDPSRF